MKTPLVFLLLAAGLEAVLSEDKYFEIGGKLSLKPESVPKEGISAITWKHKGNIVAEWIKDSVNLTYLGDFKGRTALNTTTGELTIRPMTKADEGVFTVEVNFKTQTVDYSARGITHLRDKKIEVVTRPLTCETNSPRCTLSCLGHVTDAGPVQYFWQQDKEQWKESQRDININNDDETQLIKTFSCKIKNPISEKESQPLENPFMKKSEEQSNAGLVAGIIVLVLIIIAGIALSVYAYKYPQKFAPYIDRLFALFGRKRPEEQQQGVEISGTDPQRTEANTGASNNTSPEPDETKPLKDPETGTTNVTP